MMPIRKIEFYNFQTHETIRPDYYELDLEDFYLFFIPKSPIVTRMIPKDWEIDSITYYPDDKKLYYFCLGGE